MRKAFFALCIAIAAITGLSEVFGIVQWGGRPTSLVDATLGSNDNLKKTAEWANKTEENEYEALIEKKVMPEENVSNPHKLNAQIDKAIADGYFYKLLQKLEADMSKDVPIILDDGKTVLFKVDVKPPNITNYHYQLPLNRIELSGNWDNISKNIKDENLSYFCSSYDAVYHRKAKAKINYKYYDKDMGFINQVEIDLATDCQ